MNQSAYWFAFENAKAGNVNYDLAKERFNAGRHRQPGESIQACYARGMTADADFRRGWADGRQQANVVPFDEVFKRWQEILEWRDTGPICEWRERYQIAREAYEFVINHVDYPKRHEFMHVGATMGRAC